MCYFRPDDGFQAIFGDVTVLFLQRFIAPIIMFHQCDTQQHVRRFDGIELWQGRYALDLIEQHVLHPASILTFLPFFFAGLTPFCVFGFFPSNTLFAGWIRPDIDQAIVVKPLPCALIGLLAPEEDDVLGVGIALGA